MITDEGLKQLELEIRGQGYDERTAWQYAQLIGDTPIIDAAGNVVVQDDSGLVLATLKPLKFFRC